MQNLKLVGAFNDLQIYCRSGELSSELRSCLVQFWLDNGAIANAHDAWLKTFEVAVIVTDHNGAIVAVSSVYADRLMPDGPTYWFYRTFIQREKRFQGLSNLMFHSTFAHLADQYKAENGAPAGVVIVTENPKLERPGGHRILQRGGVEKIGTDHRGNSVWRKNFVL